MAKDKMEAWLSGPNGEKIEVVIANNDGMAMGAVEALKANGKPKTPVFGVDALAEVLVMVENGEVAGTVLNDGMNQGKAAYEIARNLGQGKKPTEGTEWKLNGKVLRVPYVGVDKDNLKDFKK
ncbi:MAG: substrate-binding domain-containing protein, partial [Cetobacterium sp.]